MDQRELNLKLREIVLQLREAYSVRDVTRCQQLCDEFRAVAGWPTKAATLAADVGSILDGFFRYIEEQSPKPITRDTRLDDLTDELNRSKQSLRDLQRKYDMALEVIRRLQKKK